MLDIFKSLYTKFYQESIFDCSALLSDIKENALS